MYKKIRSVISIIENHGIVGLYYYSLKNLGLISLEKLQSLFNDKSSYEIIKYKKI